MDYLKYHAFALLFIAAGILLLAFAILKIRQLFAIKKQGIKADGIIFSLEETSFPVSNTDSYTPRRYKQQVTVRFLTTNKEWITKVYKPDINLSYRGQYAEGEKIKLIYNPADPSDFIIETKQPEWVLILFSFLLSAIVLGYGIMELFKEPVN